MLTHWVPISLRDAFTKPPLAPATPTANSHRMRCATVLAVLWCLTFILLHPGDASATVSDSEPFDPRRIPLELQAWWTPNFGHVHVAARLPIGQVVSGTLKFDVRIVIHNNPSRLRSLSIRDDASYELDIRLDKTCPYDGTHHSTCVYNVPVTMDTTQLRDGWRELRIRAKTTTPDGLSFFNSSGIPINVQNGGPDSNDDRFCNNTSLIGRGWYEGFDYTNAIIECVPLQPVAGMHTFRVRAQKPSAHLTVALDKSHSIAAVGPWPKQPDSPGQILFDKDGDYQSFFPIEVDTTRLSDGWHSLSVTSTGPDGAPSTCDYCDGEINHPAGVAKIWFYVDNDGTNPPAPPPAPEENQPPSVDAGDNQTILLGTEASLQGTVDDDGLPDPPGDVTVSWSKISGPGTVVFDDPSAVRTTARFSQLGTYELALLADDSELIDTDEVTVTVSSNDQQEGAPAHAETISGGSERSLTVSTSSSLMGVSGDLYIAAIATKSFVGVSAVSGLGLSWRLIDEQCAGRNATGLSIFVAQGVPSGNGLVTAHLNKEPANAIIAVSRYANTHLSSALGRVVSHNTNGADGSCSGGSDGDAYQFTLPTASLEGVIYSAIAMRNKSHTPGAGYTEQLEGRQGTSGSTAGITIMDKPFTGPSGIIVDGSFSSRVDWSVIAIELQ